MRTFSLFLRLSLWALCLLAAALGAAFLLKYAPLMWASGGSMFGLQVLVGMVPVVISAILIWASLPARRATH